MSLREWQEIQEVSRCIVIMEKDNHNDAPHGTFNKITEHPLLIPCGVFLIYALGFVVWNLYLAAFGVFEFNFLQTRYLSTGILSFIIIGTAAFLVSQLHIFLLGLHKFQNDQSRKRGKIVKTIFFLYFFGIFTTSFSLLAFPRIPQWVGGAQPIAISLIGTSEQIEYLKNFNIDSAENGGNPSVQTRRVCLLYQNEHYLLLGVQRWQTELHGPGGQYLSRVLFYKSDQILGYQSKRGEVTDEKCNAFHFLGI
jgi:hypothetical protein